MEGKKLISRKEMMELLGCKSTALWTRVQKGLFPKPVMLNGRTVGWTQEAYLQWLEENTAK